MEKPDILTQSGSAESLVCSAASDTVGVMTVTLDQIYRFPVKGMGPDPLDSVALQEGDGLPFDRHWAVVHGSSKVDPAAPTWAKKANFLCLARDEKLAQLDIAFDEETRTLTVLRKGKQISRAKLDDHMGRTLLQTFLTGFMPDGPRGNPKVVEAPQGVAFTDVEAAKVSIINMASVRDIERVTREPVDPMRFRGNLYLEGLDAWKEFDWVDKQIQIGDCVLQILERIDRCAATNVNPQTGTIDMNIPLSLRKGFGHIDCGIHAKVVRSGTIKLGDTITVL
ncbi:MAG TPA: MOSC domain-containing protein [Rhodospirillaceae bacterium]|nr:MOSC domain-containing protein [Rhodospirillaceae bacterium]MAX63185.1 MOSC domain-containing protein [Rhodospirillaceae bacterium]MBB59426.1 MOSC domain-containing protein [Rhodospirillaceae bacterium]HAE00950.1 MOSC domain-containing protein [Rhodospirillaceae bacterium]HAJ19412.1 MOSC domain-containing protein [Rhodospirillaceae bacterium]